jgi:hypothetical protein
MLLSGPQSSRRLLTAFRNLSAPPPSRTIEPLERLARHDGRYLARDHSPALR